tara:strand:- start:2819 stop:3220 length:402 start_codon:yes stop_codon:yes gene_type:complete
MLKNYSSEVKPLVFNTAGAGDVFIDEYLADPEVEVSSVVIIKGEFDAELPHLPHMKCRRTGDTGLDCLIDSEKAKIMVVEMLTHNKPVVLVFVGKAKMEGALKLKKIKPLIVDPATKPKKKVDKDAHLMDSWN